MTKVEGHPNLGYKSSTSIGDYRMSLLRFLPQSFQIYSIPRLSSRRMSLKTIAVLDEADLKDGQMYVLMLCSKHILLLIIQRF